MTDSPVAEPKRKTAAIVLAAGLGKRMKSRQPKVLHRVCGRPMLLHVLDAIATAGADETVVVVGHGAERVEDAAGHRARFALQAQQLGTGHAVMSAAPKLRGFEGDVLICCGDTPLLRAETLKRLIEIRRGQGDKSAGVVLTADLANPQGYGRVMRNRDGRALRIVEQKDLALHEESVREINAGVYCVDAKLLFGALERVGQANAQGEYYLTDIVEILARDGKPLDAFKTADLDEIQGVNSRKQLADAEGAMRRRILEHLMDEGVTIIDPATTYVDAQVKVGRDTILRPFTMLEGETVVGEESFVGPHVRVYSSDIGAGARVWESVIQNSSVGDGASIGPYVYLHAGCQVAPGVSLGGFLDIAGERVKRDGAFDAERARGPLHLLEPASPGSRNAGQDDEIDDEEAREKLREEKTLDAPDRLRDFQQELQSELKTPPPPAESASDEPGDSDDLKIFPSGWKPRVPVPQNVLRDHSEMALERDARLKRKEAERLARERDAARNAARAIQEGAGAFPAEGASIMPRANIGRRGALPPALSENATPSPDVDDAGGFASPRERQRAAQLGLGKVVAVPDPDNPDLLAVERAHDVLLGGGIVAFPTDTVYGLACDATNRAAVAKLREAKRRDAAKPLVAMIHSERMLRMMVREIAPDAEKLMERFWPGALTIIFKRPKAVLESLSADNAIGVRMPNHYLATAIISMMERPLAVTSANLSGEPPLNSAREIEAALGESVDLILDAPARENVPPSTVVDMTGDAPKILRAGAITEEMIREALGSPEKSS
jgi:bifunctional UDP-N-acetylglucosamine pyrophosphorylase/glucosamine-1-phosphate N-acetyltransferase